MTRRDAIVWVVFGILALFTMCVFARERSIKSVDTGKIRLDKYANFVENLFWPSHEVITEKSISKKIIPTEIEKFKSILKAVLKPQYLPREEVIDSNTVALENFREEGDYILLEYREDKLEIEIQDGKALYISIFPTAKVKLEQSDMVEYVKSTAFQILNIPQSDEKGNRPEVFVSSLDIGGSKCGTITYEAPPPKFWYSYVRWWSDGRNVLFGIGKLQFNGEDLSKRAGPPENMNAPRKFKKHNESNK